MKHYQVCKYDKSNLSYRLDWTSAELLMKGVGEQRDAVPAAYSRVEKQYLCFTSRFLLEFASDPEDIAVEGVALNFNDAELSSEWYTRTLLRSSFFGDFGREIVSNAAKRKSVKFLEAICLLQLCLRNLAAGKLRPNSDSYLAVGEDFYLLVGVPDSFDLERFRSSGELYYYESDISPWE